MTIEEKRKELDDYCRVRLCTNCRIDDKFPNHECGRGKNFVSEDKSDDYYISDYVVKKYYDYLFEMGDVKDNVEHPNHYETGKFECIDVMQEVIGIEAVKDFCVCNAFKYIYRHRRKNGKEDLEKARWYINKYLELSEKESEE